MHQRDFEFEKKDLSERLWLAYFNAYLYEHGIITESERNRMAVAIQIRKPINKTHVILSL